MSHTNAERIWNTLTKNAGLDTRDSITKKPLYGTHCLRRYFQTAFGNESGALFFMGKRPENIATYNRLNPKALDLVYIKGAENLVVFKEKSDLPEYLDSYDNQIKDLGDRLELSEERNDIYKHRLKT